jgi:pyruvate,orthophosphate dikinase
LLGFAKSSVAAQLGAGQYELHFEEVPVTLAQEMFAVAPAIGKANLSGAQEHLLAGKARWLHLAAEAGLPVVPTIALTRAAWEALQDERRHHDSRLRTHWVATLFRLVGRDGKPPLLAVRTSAEQHSKGLMPAKIGLPAPANEAESVDPGKPLARAIADAFASYGAASEGWTGTDKSATREGHIVVVQAVAEGELRLVLTRDTQTGELGPAPLNGAPLEHMPAGGPELAAALDAAAGQALCCLVELGGNRLRLVSARSAQLSAAAELEAAVDRVSRKVWSPAEAVARTDPARLQQMLHPRLRSPETADVIATGLGVSPGAASGVIVFTAEDAARMKARGRHCILVVTETGPADIQGMKAATGILTASCGMTSHAAVVARITGKPCVAGVRSLCVDVAELTCRIGD